MRLITMKHDYTFYGWDLSMFSGKVRAFMNYKQLDYKDAGMSAYTLLIHGFSKTGARVMPLVKTKDGEWLQDTTIIIEELEKRHTSQSTAIATPRQYIASLLMEAWGDEWWVPVAMHYRWSYLENFELFLREAGEGMLPGFPRFLQNKVGKVIAKGLGGAARIIGFVPQQHQMIETWTEGLLDLLEQHFSIHDYVLGGRPTIADYSLVASFYGHLDRDPAPKRILLDPRPKLRAWAERTHSGKPSTGELYENDELPETLLPILAIIFNEFMPMLDAYTLETKAHIKSENLQPGENVKRLLRPVSFPMGEDQFTRHTMPYTLWMMQRVKNKHLELSKEDRKVVDGWFEQACGKRLTTLDLGPQLTRTGLATRLA